MEDTKAYYALTRRAFDLLAPFYDLLTLPLLKVRGQVVDFANAAKGANVLDVATGTGQQAFAFANRGCAVTAVDLTESMLAVAQQHNQTDRVKFEAADATHLRFEAGSFDVACISFALHDMPLPIRTKVLQEMVRVTRPDGVIVIVDYGLPRNKLGRALIYSLVSLYEAEYYRQFIASDLEALLRNIGIEIMGKRSTLLGAVTIFTGRKEEPPTHAWFNSAL